MVRSTRDTPFRRWHITSSGQLYQVNIAPYTAGGNTKLFGNNCIKFLVVPFGDQARTQPLPGNVHSGKIRNDHLIISHDHHHPEHADVQDSSPGSRTYAGGYRIAGILFHNGGIQPGTAFYAPSVPDAPSTMLCGTSRSRSAFADARVTAQVWRCTVGSKRCAQARLA